jgi:uncharacterized membrane protein YhaH (DUF805 family)
MNAISIWHIFVLFIVVLSLVLGILLPISKILQKAGYSGWWCLFWFVPFGNIVGLWIFAHSEWPVLSGQERTDRTSQ